MTRAIPKRLLVHECILKKKKGMDRNRNPTFEEYTLKNVRIGATLASTRGTAGETKADTMTLFVDSENSAFYLDGETVESVQIEELDCIEWSGKTFTVRSIAECFTQETEKPHHLEVTLE